MVTCREIVDDLARIFTTCLSWVFMLPVVILLVLRLLIQDSFWVVALFNNLAVCCFIPLLCLVPLGLVARARWGLLLTLPLALVGVFWFAPLWGSKDPAPATSATLKVVTFNVYRSNSQYPQVAQWLGDTDADLIFLQEVPYQYIWLILRDFKDDYPHFGTRTISQEQWTNVFLSRYPIQESENLKITDEDTPNTLQRYQLDVNGLPIAVYNIRFVPPQGQPHILIEFNNFFADYVNRYDETERNQAIDYLLDRLAGEELPFIVAGNFNLSEHSIVYNRLTAQIHDAYRQAASGLGATWPVLDILPSFVPPLLRLDYIWHSRAWRTVAAALGPQLSSDHLPVVAELELTSAQPG